MLNLIDPSNAPVILVTVVFFASALQAITGIGFGVIAGPILLVTMGSVGAIQVSIVLSFVIALILSPTTLPLVNWRLLRPLLIGVSIGSPIGALAYSLLSLESLKIIAAIVVFFMTIISTGLLSRFPVFEKDSTKRRGFVGAISGMLNTALAMPGPPVAAYATAIKNDKITVRATTLVTFLFAYPIALVFQTGVVGISAKLYPIALSLSVPTIIGTFAGLLASSFVDERVFKWMTVVFLIASTITLIAI